MNENAHIPKRIAGSFIAVAVIATLVLAGFAWLLIEVRGVASESHAVARDSRQIARETQRVGMATRRLALENRKSLVVQCATKFALRRQVAQTQGFLDANPKADLIFAIPRKVIEQGQKRNLDTLARLAVIDCRKVELPDRLKNGE